MSSEWLVDGDGWLMVKVVKISSEGSYELVALPLPLKQQFSLSSLVHT